MGVSAGPAGFSSAAIAIGQHQSTNAAACVTVVRRRSLTGHDIFMYHFPCKALTNRNTLTPRLPFAQNDKSPTA